MAICITLLSCQKEIDWSTGTENALLIRSVQKSGSDSVVVDYTYDGSGRLIFEKTVGMSQGIDVGNDLQILRDGSGNITRTIQKSQVLISAGIDSIVTNYNYSTSNNRYTSAVFDMTIFGFTVTDSAAYQYDASGNISGEEHYLKFPPAPFILYFKQEYTYAGGNLSSVKQYSYDPTAMAYDLIATTTYTYDAKTTPLRLQREAVILGRPVYFGSNNATRMDFVDATDPSNNFTTDFVYSYDISSNKPLTAVSTQNPPGTVSNITYYYQ